MKGSFRQSMSWVHTWSGLTVGWVLFFVFLTGTLGYVDTEIDRWMRPEIPRKTVSAEDAVIAAQERLSRVAPGADRWLIIPPTHRDYPNLYVNWQGVDIPEGQPDRGTELLDVATAAPIEARDTAGGEALYEMHYMFHYIPLLVGEVLVGVCTMFMLVAIVTGVVVHRKIFADFFTFRFGKGQRAWLDFHTLLSVLSLPFHLMITYSGLIFFAYLYMPLIITGTYSGQGLSTFFNEVLTQNETVTRSNRPASLVSLDRVVAEAEARWGRNEVYLLDISYPGDANARIHITRVAHTPLRSGDQLIFNGSDGALLGGNEAHHHGANNVREFLLGLHEGLFAGPLLRLLYLIAGFAGTAMIGTGLVLWTVKRKVHHGYGHRGHRLVDRLNIVTIAGLPLGIAAYFLANRLLPLDMAGRADWEIRCLFLTWLAALLYTVVRPVRRAWVEGLAATAMAFLLLPFVNALTTERGFIRSLLNQDWVFVGFDCTALVTALLFLVAAWRVQRRNDQLQSLQYSPGF